MPWEGLGPALLYLTGSDMFNRFMRQYARYQGFTLHDRGLQRTLTERSTGPTVSLVWGRVCYALLLTKRYPGQWLIM